MAISPPIKRSMDAPLIPRSKPNTRHKFRVQNFHVRVRIRLFERSQSSYLHGSVQSCGARQQGAAVAPSLFVFSRSAYRILHSGSSVFRGSVDFLSLLSSKILFGACNVVIVSKRFFNRRMMIFRTIRNVQFSLTPPHVLFCSSPSFGTAPFRASASMRLAPNGAPCKGSTGLLYGLA